MTRIVGSSSARCPSCGRDDNEQDRGEDEERGQHRHGLHQLDPVFLGGKALVHFQKRYDPFHVPKIVRGRPPLDVSVHGVLEQDGADNPLPVEGGTSDDAGPHLMDDGEHLLVAGPRILLNSVKTQGFRRAAAALIQRRNETGTGLNFLQLFCVNGDRFHDDVSLNSRW